MCEHKFGIKKRDDNTYYCPVCRATIIKEELDSSLRSGQGWWEEKYPRTGRLKKI